MATTLTSAAIITRKSVRYGIYFVIFLVVARILFGIGSAIYKAVVPPRVPPPTVAFGPLPSIKFPANAGGGSLQLNYVLETATGTLPNAPTQLPVYYIKPTSATLFSADAAIAKARAFGFSGQPNQITQTLYEFVHPDLPKTMEINIVTGEFTVNYNLSSDRSPLQGVPPGEADAISRSSRLLTSANSLAEDLNEGEKTVEYLVVRDQQLAPALSQSNASLTRVNFFRKGYGPEDFYPSVTATPGRGNVWAILSGDRQNELVSAQYKYFEVDEEQSATYPIKTTAEAFQDLMRGNAYIASVSGQATGDLKVRNIYLAYYDPNVPSEFYQPVYVFEGDNNFVAYVPAVTDAYYGVE